MKRIIGIKFSHYGQIYFFYCEDPFVDRGDRVLAETGQGLGIATVMNIVDAFLRIFLRMVCAMSCAR